MFESGEIDLVTLYGWLPDVCEGGRLTKRLQVTAEASE